LYFAMVWNTSKKIAYFLPEDLIHDNEIKLIPMFCHSTVFFFFKRYFYSILIFSLASCSLTPSLPENKKGLDQAQDTANQGSNLYEKRGGVLKADQSKSFEGDSLLDLLEAEIAGHRGDYQKALKNYENVAVSTMDLGVLRRAFNIAEYLKESEAALRLAKIWAAKEPNSLNAHSKIIEKSLRLGLFDVALSSMKDLKKLGGTPNFEILTIAMAERPTNEKKKILGVLEELIASFPNDPGLLITAATFYSQVSSFDKALTVINALLREGEDPKKISLKARILIAKDEVENAEDVLRSYLKENEEELGLLVLLAQVLFEQEDFEKAKAQYQRALELRPNDGALLLALAIISLEQGDDEEAEKILERMIRWSLRVEDAYFHLAGIMERKKDLSQALEHYKKVSGGYGFMASQMRIASLIETLEGLESSRNHFTEQRSAYPLSSRNFSLLEAQFLSERKLFNEAIGVLDSELDSKPNDIGILYRKALIGGEAGRFNILEKALTRILEIEPDNADALNSLGYTLADKTDRYQEAFELVSKALSIRPDDPAFIDSMGWVHYRLNNLEQAISYLTKALSLLKDDEIAAHLGEALWMSGRKSEALEVWKNGLKLDSESRVLRNAKEKFQPE